MTTTQALIGYDEALELTGFSKRTLINRIARTGVRIWVDGRDHRRRLIAREDVARLIEIEEVERGETVAA